MECPDEDALASYLGPGGDSRREQIAAHLATAMKGQEPDARFSVRAFEGVGKGARASA